MGRVALFIEVNRYQPGLDLPSKRQETEALYRLLSQPHLQLQAQRLEDCPLPEIQQAVESFAQSQSSDDFLIFVFSGYGFQDPDGLLYFLTSDTTINGQGLPDPATLLPLQSVQRAMNGSSAKQQVVILDCCFRQVFGNQSVLTETPLELWNQLGANDRVVLTAHTSTRHGVEPARLESWSYLHYLTEGIETGAADLDSNGTLSAEDLHRYAKQKLQIAAPAMAPERYGSDEVANRPLIPVTTQEPAVRYRKFVEQFVDRHEVDAIGSKFAPRHSMALNDVQQSLELSPQEAAAIEFQALRPVREYRQRLRFYQEQRFNLASQPDPDGQRELTLSRLQQALSLTDQDVAEIATVPQEAGPTQVIDPRQQDLLRYEQVLLAAAQRQYPLADDDRQKLQSLAHVLQLRNEDVQAIEARVAEQFTSANRRGINDALYQRSLATAPTALNYPDPGVTVMPASEPTSLQSPPPVVSQAAEPLPPPPVRDSRPARARRSSSDLLPLFGLLIPLVLLLGAWLAWRSAGSPQIANILPNFGRPANTNASVAQFNNWGRIKARQGNNQEAITEYNKALQIDPDNAPTHVNRGVAYHRLGNLDAALRDYDRAIDLLQKGNNQGDSRQQLALAHSNRSHVRYDRQDYQGAMEDANAAVTLDRGLPQAYINLANARFVMGDADGALKDYDRAISLKPNRPILATAYSNQGNVLLAQNDLNAAFQNYNQAIRLDPNYADAFYNRGIAYQTLENRGRAIDDFREAARLYQVQGSNDLAEEALARVTELQQDVPARPQTETQTTN